MSNYQLIILIAFCLFTLEMNALTCGKNCPDNSCSSCPCGTASAATDINGYCTLHPFGQTCCKCIGTRESTANQKYMRETSPYGIQVGVLPIDQYDYLRGACTTPFPQKSCYVHEGSDCAYKVYQFYGWGRWQESAKACGCPISESTEEQKRNLAQKKEAMEMIIVQK